MWSRVYGQLIRLSLFVDLLIRYYHWFNLPSFRQIIFLCRFIHSISSLIIIPKFIIITYLCFFSFNVIIFFLNSILSHLILFPSYIIIILIWIILISLWISCSLIALTWISLYNKPGFIYIIYSLYFGVRDCLYASSVFRACDICRLL